MIAGGAIVADTSGLLALFNEAEPKHADVVSVVEASASVIVSPYVVAELDYLLATRVGVAEELAALRELASGAYDLPVLDRGDVATAASIVERYDDQRIGIADASLVVLAERYRTKLVLTLDRRHFEVLRPLDGGRFEVLPG